MILVIKEKHTKEYRLQAFEDFYKKLPDYCNCVFWGLDSPNYNSAMTIQDIIKECPEEPDAIFVMSPLMKYSDWSNINAKRYLLVTDSVCSMDKWSKWKHYPNMEKIKWNAVFHNYYHCIKFMKSVIETDWIFFPNWAADCYDYNKYGKGKIFNYFLSGKYSHEYAMRKVFHKAFHKAGFEVIDNFKEERINTNTDNIKFRKLLLRSRYSPHDGGINGRMVPRYVESALAKSVIISPYLGIEMDEIGFVSGENYIEVNRKWDIKKLRKFLYYTIPTQGWERLAENAYKMAQNHTTESRIKQFLGVINEG